LILTIENVNRQLKINAVIKGILLGFIVLVFSIFSYYFITRLTTTPQWILGGPYIFAIIIPLVVTLFFCVNLRGKLGGYWTFRQAVTSIFIMFLVCYAILTIGRDLVFSKLIEPNMVHNTEEVMLNVKAQSLKINGQNPAQVKQQVSDLRQQFDSQTTPGVFVILQNYIINIILLFVLAIVFSAIFKKDPKFAPVNK